MTTKMTDIKSFTDFTKALAWARTYARESCHAHNFWHVERLDNSRDAEFVVAVRSRNTGRISGYAS